MPSWTPAKTGGSGSSGRRSQRVLLSIPVIVRTKDGQAHAAFNEETQTLVVNAHGALIALAGRVEQKQTLHLVNRTTKQELECRVTYVGPITAGKAQIGVEFTTPSPDFWRIAFPPEDWVTPDEPAATSNVTSERPAQSPPPKKKV
jgi:hypothetical protein